MTIIIASLIKPAGLSYAGSLVRESSTTRNILLAYEIIHKEEQEPHTIVNITVVEANEPIRSVTYGINMTTVGIDEPLLQYDAFHAENGTLVLDIAHRVGETKVFAAREDFLDAWKAGPGGKVNVEMALETSSTYLMHIDILGLDNIRIILPPDQVPSVNLYFNTDKNDMGEVMVVPGELVVVPEFPYPVVLIVSVVIGSIIAISRSKDIANNINRSC